MLYTIHAKTTRISLIHDTDKLTRPRKGIKGVESGRMSIPSFVYYDFTNYRHLTLHAYHLASHEMGTDSERGQDPRISNSDTTGAALPVTGWERRRCVA